MNLLKIKQLVIEMSGRADLVANELYYDDAGIMDFINAGQRFLEDYKDLPHMEAMSAHNLALGQFAVHDPWLKWLREAWIVKTDNSRIKLTYAAPGDAYERQSYSAVDPGTPGYYWLESNRIAHEEILNDVGLTNAGVTWTDNSGGSNWTVSNGWVKHTAGDINTYEQLFAQLANGHLLTENETYLVGFEIRDQPLALPQALRVDVAGSFGTYRTKDGVYYETIVAGGSIPYVSFNPHTDFEGKLGRFSVKKFPQDDNETLFRGSWDEQYNSVVLLPKTDIATYVLELYGHFYTPYLQHNGDVNYWTLNHPIMLAQAANFFIEGGMRNSAGVADFMSLLEVQFKALKARRIHQTVQNSGTQRYG